jgi:cytochrome c biogenesis protein CcmG, thiol:disulfide interchange protein DsbE
MLVLAGLTAFVIVAIAALAVLSTTGGGTEGFTANDEGLIPVGEKAPSFTAETVDGGSVTVGEGGSPATMLVFFATWCPHCQKEAPILSELEGQYEGLSMVMVGIDGEDDAAKVRQFVEEYDIESPAVYEPALGSEYGVSGYPTVYVLDENNKVIGAHSGEAPREIYEGWIEKALGSGG